MDLYDCLAGGMNVACVSGVCLNGWPSHHTLFYIVERNTMPGFRRVARINSDMYGRHDVILHVHDGIITIVIKGEDGKKQGFFTTIDLVNQCDDIIGALRVDEDNPGFMDKF